MTYRIVARSLRHSVTVAVGIVLAFGVLAPSTGRSPFALLATTGIAYAAAPLTPAEVVLPFEAQMLTLVNADRAAQGLAPLKVDPTLARIARWRSEDMATANYFSHDIGNVPGRVVFQVLLDQGVDYDAAGENLARYYLDQADPTKVAEAALMDSPTHRRNILRPDFTHLGVGVAVSRDGRVIYTQLFKAVRPRPAGAVTYSWSR